MADGNKHPLVSYQPLRLLFQLTYLGTVVARLPLWAFTALVKPFRPHPGWSAKQTFMVRAAYAIVDIESRVSITKPLSLKGGKEGNRFQTVEPPQSLDRYKGPLESDSVKPAVVGGTWYPHAPAADIASKLVVLYFHGGAFVKGDGRTDDAGFAAESWIQKGGADAVFSLQYRLSGYSGRDPFPAALQDALTSYLFLLDDLKIPARQIVLSGDSAGANLVVALLRYLYEHGTELGLPVPRCAALISPWVAPFNYKLLGNPNSKTDFLPESFLRWGANAYAGRFLADPESHPYITPLGNPFPSPVPVFASGGSAEVLFADIAQWVKEMEENNENKIEFYQEDAACHDTLLVGGFLGFEESAWTVAAKMGDFVRKC
ncbi:alpha/beta hydrolase fold-3 domain-containing protein [Hypoxylon rubiginosum]|uniref:Alpha/beta hydrolase fold-3 domain-containing protein n=1 Tax=Hypoxylon rubiginosum TaxID=110542 RepID=A0ACB9YJ94_9PEZI|nr:alpha/beta hydrolase fold-3 domain-containing protein [Hypoxylon rubiginosum]